jgi:hypothetical protein
MNRLFLPRLGRPTRFASAVDGRDRQPEFRHEPFVLAWHVVIGGDKDRIGLV